VALGDCLLPELEGFLLHPVRIPKKGSERGEDFFPPGLSASRILWRGHANQGRCEPGRRAVLEENKVPSDRCYSTPSAAFSQAEINHKHQLIAFIFRLIEIG
jgi:hypothetical protein